MASTIVFDLYGVLVTPSLEASIEKLTQLLGVDPELLVPAYRAQEPAFDRGQLTEAGFWRRVLNAIGAEHDWQELNDTVIDSCELLPDGVALLEEVRRSSHETALLTNARSPWVSRLDSRFGLLSRFDSVFVSSELGEGKPDQEIYEIVERILDASGQRLLLIDDSIINVEAAQARGWDALLYESALLTEPALRNLTVEGTMPPYSASYSGVIVLTADGRVVLQLRDFRTNCNPGMLSVFGGDSKRGETAIDCARRELSEETGVLANDLEPVGVLAVPTHRLGYFKSCSYFVFQLGVSQDVNVLEGAGHEIMPLEDALASDRVTHHARLAIELYRPDLRP